MATPKVYFVHLRRPGQEDARTDPLYEFGSFGCTKCHSRNLLHPRHAAELEGSRLAFAQGGSDGFRLVFLTPPITVKVWASNCEARWTPPQMPFKYSEAPVLIANDERSDFSLVRQFARETDRSTLEGGFSSRLRSRSRPLSAGMAREVVSVYERFRKYKGSSAIASSYAEALPYVTRIDSDRELTHSCLIQELCAEAEEVREVPTSIVRNEEPQSVTRCSGSPRPPYGGRSKRLD